MKILKSKDAFWYVKQCFKLCKNYFKIFRKKMANCDFSQQNLKRKSIIIPPLGSNFEKKQKAASEFCFEKKINCSLNWWGIKMCTHINALS